MPSKYQEHLGSPCPDLQRVQDHLNGSGFGAYRDDLVHLQVLELLRGPYAPLCRRGALLSGRLLCLDAQTQPQAETGSV